MGDEDLDLMKLIAREERIADVAARIIAVAVVLCLLCVIFACTRVAHADGPSLNDVVRVSSARGNAHACPLEGGLLITNGHVVTGSSVLRWSDGQGNQGLAALDREPADADLAVLRVTRGHVGREFHVATSSPQPGDRVFMRGYRYDSRKNAMAERRVETRVTRIEAGHLYFEEPGLPGSSGSCVFNASGEVVAINRGGIALDAQNQYSGFAIAIWGEWARDLDPPAESQQ